MNNTSVRILFILMMVEFSSAQADTEQVRGQSAELLFASYCASCHGPAGKGGAGVPDLTDNVWKFGGSPEDIKRSIAEGRKSVMPGLGVALGERGLDQVVAFVLSLSGSSAAPQSNVLAGRDLFTMFCASCHGEKGAGTQVIGALDLSDGVWLHGSDPEDIRDVVANGRASEMPAQQEILDPDNISRLATYVKDLSDAESNR